MKELFEHWMNENHAWFPITAVLLNIAFIAAGIYLTIKAIFWNGEPLEILYLAILFCIFKFIFSWILNIYIDTFKDQL